MELKNINKLPVITWRWLKVNDLDLNLEETTNIPDYKKDYIKQFRELKNGKVVEIKKEINSVDYSNKFQTIGESYGVSKGLLDLAESNYNAPLSIKLDKNSRISQPIIIDYSMSKENPVLIDNNTIVAEENSEITVIINYKTNDEVEAFHNGITKIYAMDGAKVNIIKVQIMNENSKHFDSVVGFIGYGSKVNYISLEIGASISVTNYVNNLDKPTGEAKLKSIYFGDGNKITDLSYKMNHSAMRTLSNIETRGVLKDKSKKIFRGTIDFKKGSVKAKGSEEEYAILLDPRVKSDAVPLLLCAEDDVEGQHAASAGKINEDKLFYLMSRGFSEKEAKKLIIEAAFRPIIDEIPSEDIKNIIDSEIQRRIIND